MGDRVQQTVWNRRNTDDGPRRVGAGAVILRSSWIIAAGAIMFALGLRFPAYIAAGIGVFVTALGLIAPRAWRRLDALGERFSAWVGKVLGWVLLTPVFVLVVIPGGLWLKLRGRDPLHRRHLAAGYSYWIRRGAMAGPEQYARQFLVEDRRARAEARPLAGGNGGERP